MLEIRRCVRFGAAGTRRRLSSGTSATDLFAEDGAGKPKGASRTKQTLRTRSRFDDDFALGRAHDRARDEEEFELLCPEELEEAADVLVADVDWLEADLVVFVRLMTTLDIRLERHAKCRFVVLVMGPAGDDAHKRHVRMGEAAAALLQDEVVVAAACKPSPARDHLCRHATTFAVTGVPSLTRARIHVPRPYYRQRRGSGRASRGNRSTWAWQLGRTVAEPGPRRPPSAVRRSPHRSPAGRFVTAPLTPRPGHPGVGRPCRILFYLSCRSG